MPFHKLRGKKAAPRIVLVGNFGAENMGDELILAGFLKKLGQELPKAKVVVLGGNPNLVRRFHGVDALLHLPTGWRSFWHRGWWRSLQAVKKCDVVVFPGGGLFSDEEGFRAIWIWGIHILLARYFWKPVFLIGQSVGKIEGEYAKDFARKVLCKAEWIGVRDTASAAELKRLGIADNKIKQDKDSSFWLINRFPKSKAWKKNGVIKILVSLRSFPKIEEEFFEEIAKALNEISEKTHARISFASFGKGDFEVWRKICRNSRNAKLWKVLELPESAEGVIRAVKKFDVIVGMRLHSLISAKLAGVPAVGFAYSRKVKEFAENSLDVENFKAEKLVKYFS
ncbi:polysaccharide pyruvyl transferase family protein [Candidatus Gracilibacteria bacterium]|nr:polysaccharide pyruvyl transferase family protein [Candidatus Gracilibacteria bacterium]MCF7856523.1 polysaccharide pyruvyl transferase family protein [Candidatus Gracilibacteria bacterium]MCF7896581.1 polysaccharide pyruvyl transferase family protein [Candidatus Gracilibacteria bacterium]